MMQTIVELASQAPPPPKYKPAPVRKAAEGEPGKLVTLPIADLLLDKTYQRPLARANWANIQQISAAFDWLMFGAVTVVQRGSKYAVIDGQHRAIAAAMRGDIKAVPCLVIKATRQTEARIFSGLNGKRIQLSALALHRAAIAAEDSQALAVEKACAAHGVKIAPYPKSPSDITPGETMSVTTLVRAWRALGDAAFRTGTAIVDAQSWPGGIPQSAFIAAYAYVRSTPSVDADEVIAAIRAVGGWQKLIASNLAAGQERASKAAAAVLKEAIVRAVARRRAAPRVTPSTIRQLTPQELMAGRSSRRAGHAP